MFGSKNPLKTSHLQDFRNRFSDQDLWVKCVMLEISITLKILLDSTPTTLPPSDFIIDSEMANNSTIADPYIECNVILLPFLVFFCICLMIIYVMCKYKICAKDKNDLSEKEETQKQ